MEIDNSGYNVAGGENYTEAMGKEGDTNVLTFLPQKSMPSADDRYGEKNNIRIFSKRNILGRKRPKNCLLLRKFVVENDFSTVTGNG